MGRPVGVRIPPLALPIVEAVTGTRPATGPGTRAGRSFRHLDTTGLNPGSQMVSDGGFQLLVAEVQFDAW